MEATVVSGWFNPPVKPRTLWQSVIAWSFVARKYSPPHTPIEVVARASHTEVIISVHNVGSTIRIEDRDRIFDRFYRALDLKDSVPGTGIGLSVVKKAAEAHSGHVWVVSDEDEGTTFFLSLPNFGRTKH